MTRFPAILAEFLGTFILVFCGTGAIVVNEVMPGSIGHVGISMTFGLIVSVLIFALGDVSGAHLNPAVTIAFALRKHFDRTLLFPYIASQTSGAFTASWMLAFLFPDSTSLGATLPSGSVAQSFIFEFILTFILLLVILNVSSGSREKGLTAALAIGATVGLEAMFAGPVCGASMNPVRSLAPAILSSNTQHLWIYLTAPFIGAGIAVFIHQTLYSKKI